jgi:hypothetical protein
MHMEGVNPYFNPKKASLEHIIIEGTAAYPNPSKRDFTADMREIINKARLKITGIYGRMILSKTFTNRQLLNFALEEPAGV